jgi:hypothetical protein
VQQQQERQPSQAQPWEYKLVSMGNPLQPDTELRANVVGKLGWELAAIDAGVWVFKRPQTDQAEAPSALEAIIEETVPIAGQATEPVASAS